MKESLTGNNNHYTTSFSRKESLHFEGFIQGNESSFTFIYGRLRGTLRRYGLRIVQDEFVVDTILQEAFLKLWAFRERMTSLEHAARFLKLNMRWECLHYYRHPMETLYRKAARFDWEWLWDIIAPAQEEDEYSDTENQLHLIRAMIPHLPDHRQRTIMSLYVKDGMPVGQIAQRLHTSAQMVGKELQQGLNNLRSRLVHSKKQENGPISSPVMTIRPIEGLTSEQTHIITMRRDMQYTFNQIADLLKLPQPYVQKQYVEAWKKCCEMKV